MRIALATVALALFAAASAHAEIRAGTVALSGSMSSVNVAYDRDAGHVTVTTTYPRPPFGVTGHLWLAEGCANGLAGVSARINVQVLVAAEPPSGRIEAFGPVREMAIPGSFAVSEDRLAVTADVTDASLAGREWRCATGSIGRDNDPQYFKLWFAGHQPQAAAPTPPSTDPPDEPVEGDPQPPVRLTPGSATALVRAEIERQWPGELERSADVWIACPKEQMDAEAGRARCELEYALGSSRRYRRISAAIVDGAVRWRGKPWIKEKRLVRCSWLPRKRLPGGIVMVNRTLWTRPGACAVDKRFPVSFFDRVFRKAYPEQAPGTLRITPAPRQRGFEALASQTCPVASTMTERRWLYRVTCTNQRGDRLRYDVEIGLP